MIKLSDRGKTALQVFFLILASLLFFLYIFVSEGRIQASELGRSTTGVLSHQLPLWRLFTLGWTKIKSMLKSLNLFYVACYFTARLLCLLVDSFTLNRMKKKFSHKASWPRQIRTNSIANLLQAVTPPTLQLSTIMHVFANKKDGIDSAKSTSIMFFKNIFLWVLNSLILILLTVIEFPFITSAVRGATRPWLIWAIAVGNFIISYLGSIFIYLILPIFSKQITAIVTPIIRLLAKVKIVKDLSGTLNKLDGFLTNLKENMKEGLFTRLEKAKLLSLMFLNALSSGTQGMFICWALGLKGQVHYLPFWAANNFLTLVNCIPIPGGFGFGDYLSKHLLVSQIGEEHIRSYMLLSKLGSFYWPILFGLIMLLTLKKEDRAVLRSSPTLRSPLETT